MDLSVVPDLLARPLLALPLVFLGGVLTSLTPRIYPMIPITASSVMGLASVYASLGLLDGASVVFGDFVGDTPVIVEFWATWCPLCKSLEPGFAELQAEYGEAVRVVRVGVPENQSRGQQKAYVERRGIGGVHLFDPEGEAYRAFAATHTSYVVVLDAKGRVTYTDVGEDQDLRAAVATALEPARPR